MDFSPQILLMIPVFLLALSVHEFAHAWTAYLGGDETAAYQGRLTLNPLAHIDLFGTIIIPAIAILSHVPFLFGWAKPVPVQEANFRRPAWGVVVALAGPASNFVLVALTLAIAKVALMISPGRIPEALLYLLNYMLVINVVLMLFNLIPIPPLDGSHVLWHLMVKRRPELQPMFFFLTQFGFFVLMFLFMFPATRALFRALVSGVLSLAEWVLYL